jgi:hypothetical protein
MLSFDSKSVRLCPSGLGAGLLTLWAFARVSSNLFTIVIHGRYVTGSMQHNLYIMTTDIFIFPATIITIIIATIFLTAFTWKDSPATYETTD